MMHRNAWGLTAIATATAVLATTASCNGGGCPGADLGARLAAARPGDVVSIAGCEEITGHFVVPAGVTLAGPGVVRGDGASVITLETSTGATTSLRDVRIVSALAGTGVIAGVEALGEGTASLDGVTVEAGVGVAAALGAAHQELHACHFLGAVTAQNADDVRWLSPRASVEATHGVLVSRGSFAMSASEIAGFPEVALALGTGQGTMALGPVDATLSDDAIGHGLGVAIASSAATLTLTDVHVDALETGVRGWPSYALLLVDGSATTERLSITGADGFGIVQVAGESHHDALTLEGTGEAGVWVGTGVTLEIGGGSRLAGTSFAALMAVDAATISVSDTTIEDVRTVRRTVGVRGAIDVGDGIDLVGSVATLQRVTVTGAGRAGLVIDRGSAFDPSRFTGVSVSADGSALGAILGDVDRTSELFTPVSVAGWDAGITRLGAATTNDLAFTGTLPVSVVAMPPSLGSAMGVIAPMY